MGPRIHVRPFLVRSGSRLQEAPELLRARRVAQLAERLGLDLPDALARDREILSDLLERVLASVGEAEAEPEHLLLARGQRVQDVVGLRAQREADDGVDRRHHLFVLDEVAEMAILFLADRGLEGDRLLRDLEDLAHLVDRDFHLRRDLLGRRLAAELLDELARGADQLVDRLDHVHRDANRTRLVGDGPGNRLPDPPRRVGRELVAAPVLEFVDGLHETDVAFLDQVQELKATIRVFLGDRDDEPQVRLDHLLLGEGRLVLALLHDRHHLLQLVGLGVVARLGRLDLLLRDPDLLLLQRAEFLGGSEMEIALTGAAVGRARLAEGHVEEVLPLLTRLPVAVRPQLDHALGALDVLDEPAQALHEAASQDVDIFAVDDLIADVEVAQLVDDLAGELLRARFELFPRRLFALGRLLPAARLRAELFRLADELVAVAQDAIDVRERADDLPGQRGLLFLRELLVVDVDDLLHGDVLLTQELAQLVEPLEGEVGGEDGARDLDLAFLDALGERDLALACEERHAAHLAQVEPDGILRAAHW